MRWQPYNENNFSFDITKYFGGRTNGMRRCWATVIIGQWDAILNQR
ncbi:hypothetical protein P4S88_13250 [Anoxybacillus geothermalis]|nr:hypothetical protein [Anoxybacillus geothermalis]